MVCLCCQRRPPVIHSVMINVAVPFKDTTDNSSCNLQSVCYVVVLSKEIQQLYIYYHRDNLLFFFLPHRSTASLMGNSSTGGPSIAILNNESSDFSCSRFRVLVFINLN